MDTLRDPAAARELTPPPRPVRPAPGAPGTWFEARHSHGTLRLCVEPAAAGAAFAAAAAVQMGRAEPLLAALDAWIGGGLEWRWTATPGAAPAAAGVTAPWRAPGGTACRVTLPWSLLRRLRAPDPALALEWPRVPAVLVLERLALSLPELADLESGGVVLVPGSMRPGWTGWLRPAGDGGGDGAGGAAETGLPVDLSDPACPRLAPVAAVGHAPFDDPQLVGCELRLDLPEGVPASRLAGWLPGLEPAGGSAAAIVRLPADAVRATLWCLASRHEGEQALASGTLVPWGDGWALAIEAAYRSTAFEEPAKL